MASLSRPNAVDASPIRLITSLVLFGTTLPRNTNSSTCSTSSPSMTIRLHLAPFIFIPHFWHAFSSCDVDSQSFSKMADRRVVSSAYLMFIDKLPWILSLLSWLFSSIMTNSRKILNRVGDSRHPCQRPIFTANHSVNCLSISTLSTLYSIIRTILGSIPLAFYHFLQGLPPYRIEGSLEVYEV